MPPFSEIRSRITGSLRKVHASAGEGITSSKEDPEHIVNQSDSQRKISIDHLHHRKAVNEETPTSPRCITLGYMYYHSQLRSCCLDNNVLKVEGVEEAIDLKNYHLSVDTRKRQPKIKLRGPQEKLYFLQKTHCFSVEDKDELDRWMRFLMIGKSIGREADGSKIRWTRCSKLF